VRRPASPLHPQPPQPPPRPLTLLPSSAGHKQTFEGVEYTIAELNEHSFAGVQLALFSAGGDVSRAFAPLAAAAGCLVVDNSSAFRMYPGVPLVVPEVNAAALGGLRCGGGGGIVANPNCSTIIALTAVTPLHRVSPIQRMVVSTYQAASGAGAAAMAELEQQTREVLAGQPVTKNIFKQQVRPRARAAGGGGGVEKPILCLDL